MGCLRRAESPSVKYSWPYVKKAAVGILAGLDDLKYSSCPSFGNYVHGEPNF